MYELRQVGEKTFYIESPAKIGVYLSNGNSVYLIDSGSDKDAARRARKVLDERKWTLAGIINTHSNADHIGGNAYFQRQTGCPVFADGIERSFTEYPILEPSFLYGGYPCGELRHKFLLAEKSETRAFSDADFPKEIEVIPMKGHFFDMTGFRTPDDTVFLADCLSSRETLEKYRISFIYDVAEYLKTLEMVKTMKARIFVPSHAEATDDITELAQFNIDSVNFVAEKVLDICKEPLCFEKVLQILFNDYQLTMSFQQYVLVGSTVRSYLSWLHDLGRLEISFEDNMLLWRTV